MPMALPTPRLSILLCALALTSCSSKPPEPVAKAAPITTPFDGLRAAEQRAKDVQKVDKQAEEQRKQVEAAQQ
ncbi:MAG: hypothetical protein WDW38_002812 [Sanguina aurantia]